MQLIGRLNFTLAKGRIGHMWFSNPKQRLRETARKIIEGLRDGTIVPDPPLLPDPPLGRDVGEALPLDTEQEFIRKPILQ
jgi:hypothetical protein